MLIALVVLAALNLVLSFVVFCSLRVLWARMPEPQLSAEGWVSYQQAKRDAPPELTPEERAQVAAYRAKWKGVVTDDQPDLEVLALMRVNPT